MNTLDLAMKNVALKKASGTAGGEWQGPCPACGGTDRFHVWPEQNEGKGAYWCRGCGKWGDNIQYLRDFRGMSFRDACVELRIDLPDHHDRPGAPPPQKTKPAFSPVSHASPADLWQEKAEKLLAWSQAGLAGNADALAWLSVRGISRDTAINYRLGWNAGENGKDIYRARKGWGLPEQIKDDGRPKALWIPRGLVIPYIEGGVILRIRIRRPEGEPRYYVLPGSAMSTMLLGRDRRAFVVVESELDAIAVAAGNNLAGAVALGSVSAKPDAETFAVLKGALQILNALDYDAAGAKAYDWWAEQFARCSRWPVPQGKDPGEAVRLGVDLEQWIKAGLPPALTVVSPVTVRRSLETTTKEQAAAPAEKMLDFDRDAPTIPVEIRELYALLKNNPGVRIINTSSRYTVLRNGKYVGGRINELVFQHPVSRDYLMNHPAEEIHAGNLVI
jgi:hypothetical protein